jgi:hypothetical protein
MQCKGIESWRAFASQLAWEEYGPVSRSPPRRAFPVAIPRRHGSRQREELFANDEAISRERVGNHKDGTTDANYLLVFDQARLALLSATPVVSSVSRPQISPLERLRL